MDFDPHKYDLYHLGISGGKDSTAVLLWVVYESGWPLDNLVVTFCDTNNEDALTYGFLDLLSEKVHIIQKIYPERDFWELAQHKQRFPSPKARFCTSFLKIIPSRAYILNLMQRGYNVLIMDGVRKGEGSSINERGKAEKFSFDEGYACDKYRPIVDWSIDDVWDIHKKYLKLEWVLNLVENDPDLEYRNEILASMRRHGIPRNPLYDMGASRVGCFPCMMSNKDEIRGMARYRPQRIDFIEIQENSMKDYRKDGNDLSSFFPFDKTPINHRTKRVSTKSGEEINVPTIRDVVDWANTSHGGKQYDFDFLHFNADESNLLCELGGTCE